MDWESFIAGFMTCVLLVVLVLVGTAGPPSEVVTCSQIHLLHKVPVQPLGSGCQVEQGGQWIPWENYIQALEGGY